MKKLLIIIFILFVCDANAASLTFSWLPNQDNTTGYKLYWGSSIGEYYTYIDVGYPDIMDGRVYYTLEDTTDEPNTTTYYVITAYNNDLESDFSEYIKYTTPSKPIEQPEQPEPVMPEIPHMFELNFGITPF